MSNPSAHLDAGADVAFESGFGGVFVIPGITEDGERNGTTGTGAGGTGSPGTGAAETVPGDPADAASLPPWPDAANAVRDSGVGDAVAEDAVESDGADGGCSEPLGPGDLVIDELMIASQSGTGDHGEWVEITSTRDCAIDLNGLYAEVPHGQGTTTATITSDVLLPPHAAFLVADSSSAAQNHDLPGMPSLIVMWGAGTSSDVLKNSGNTITLFTATATIDALTYTATAKLVEGASMAFPKDCDPSLRTDFHNWQASLASWTPGFFGTPGAPNADVSCAILQPPAPPSPAPPCSDAPGADASDDADGSHE